MNNGALNNSVRESNPQHLRHWADESPFQDVYECRSEQSLLSYSNRCFVLIAIFHLVRLIMLLFWSISIYHLTPPLGDRFTDYQFEGLTLSGRQSIRSVPLPCLRIFPFHSAQHYTRAREFISNIYDLETVRFFDPLKPAFEYRASFSQSLIII